MRSCAPRSLRPHAARSQPALALRSAGRGTRGRHDVSSGRRRSSRARSRRGPSDLRLAERRRPDRSRRCGEPQPVIGGSRTVLRGRCDPVWGSGNTRWQTNRPPPAHLGRRLPVWDLFAASDWHPGHRSESSGGQDIRSRTSCHHLSVRAPLTVRPPASQPCPRDRRAR